MRIHMSFKSSSLKIATVILSIQTWAAPDAVANGDMQALRDCKTGKIKSYAKAEEVARSVDRLEKKDDPESINALVTFLTSCSDGALSEDLFGILGVDVLR